MNKTFIAILIVWSLAAKAQDNPTTQAQPIVAEGKLLYQLEMASWYGTDLFVEAYQHTENIGGYFSYQENDATKCIFFSKADDPKVIGTISFDSTYSTSTAIVSLLERELTERERALYAMRKVALQQINEDTFFTTYENTNLNLIPIINGNERKVFVLTGPRKNGVVIFGNDYLLTFDGANKLLNKKRLHKNILSAEYGQQTDEDKKNVGGMHSHLPETGDFITATDICTLMLYEKFTGWEQYIVVSEKYLNIWNCKTHLLIVIPKNEALNMAEDHKKRKTK